MTHGTLLTGIALHYILVMVGATAIPIMVLPTTITGMDITMGTTTVTGMDIMLRMIMATTPTIMVLAQMVAAAIAHQAGKETITIMPRMENQPTLTVTGLY